MEKLSSGLRINRAGDDASGLAVSEKMRAQIRGLRQASTNAQNGISFIQTAEGYLQESQDILQRLRELSVQASNGIYSDEDRMQIQVEVSALVNEVNRIASHAQFNGMNMLTGPLRPADGGERGHRQHVAAHRGQHGPARAGLHRHDDRPGPGHAGTPATSEIISLSTPDGANASIGVLDAALRLVNKQRADLGAYQNRLEYAVKGLAVGAENLQAAESLHPRHRHGLRDGGVREERDPRAVRHGHARPGQHEAAVGPAALQVDMPRGTVVTVHGDISSP